MTGTEPHAPRGTAGRGPNWDRGPGTGHAGAARRCTMRHRRPWAICRGRAAEASRRRMCISAPPAARPLLGSRAVRGPEELLDPERETTRRRMHISAPPAARPFLGSLAASGPEELRDSEWTYTSTHAYLGTAGRGTRKGTVGCERAGGAERSHGCQRDAVTVCFQYPAPQVTVMVA